MIEIEQAVIGALIISPNEQHYIDKLNIDYFTTESNKSIFREIKKLRESNLPIDLITIYSVCKTFGKDIMAMTSKISSVANLDYHLALLTQAKLKTDLSKLINTAAMSIDYTDTFALREKMILELEKMINIAPSKSLKIIDAVTKTMHEISEHQNSPKGETIGISTGLSTLNEITGGWKPSLVVLAARPGIGKSSLALQFGKTAAMQGKPTMIISIEMTQNEVAGRYISSISQVPLSAITKASLSERQWTEIHSAKLDLPLFVDDDENINLSTLKVKLREYKRLYNIELFIIDYLQLVENLNKFSTNDSISEVTVALKKLSKELSVPIIALSQLSRDLEKEKREPRLSDLRGSGSIEQDANMVIFLYPQTDVQEPVVQCDIIVAKNRGGKIGSIRTEFFKNTQQFREI